MSHMNTLTEKPVDHQEKDYIKYKHTQGGSTMLNITKNANANVLKVILEGRLDTTTAPQLEAELGSALSGVTDLKFDLEKLDYISSAGLRVLLSTQKIMNKQGKMVISNASAEVKEIFDVTGFSDILTIE